jgi:hypothetical protein
MQSSKILLVTTLSVGSIGLALASGCSSSSSPAEPANEAGASSSSSSGGTASSSGGGLGDADINLVCMDSTTCMTGQVCCASVSISAGLSVTSACQTGPCPTGATSYQFCASTTECLNGATCNANPLGAGPMICTGGTPGDGGSSGGHDSGTEAGSSGGDSGGDTGASDAPTGG